MPTKPFIRTRKFSITSILNNFVFWGIITFYEIHILYTMSIIMYKIEYHPAIKLQMKPQSTIKMKQIKIKQRQYK